MLHHSFGGAVIFFSLEHFIASALDLMPCLKAWGTRDCNKGVNTKFFVSKLIQFLHAFQILLWKYYFGNKLKSVTQFKNAKHLFANKMLM